MLTSHESLFWTMLDGASKWNNSIFHLISWKVYPQIHLPQSSAWTWVDRSLILQAGVSVLDLSMFTSLWWVNSWTCVCFMMESSLTREWEIKAKLLLLFARLCYSEIVCSLFMSCFVVGIHSNCTFISRWQTLKQVWLTRNAHFCGAHTNKSS